MICLLVGVFSDGHTHSTLISVIVYAKQLVLVFIYSTDGYRLLF